MLNSEKTNLNSAANHMLPEKKAVKVFEGFYIFDEVYKSL